MTAYNNPKSKEIAIYILGLFVIAVILGLNFLTFYWADDYAILNEIKELGIFKRCLNGYYTWDGRYMTPAAFFQGAFLQHLPVQLTTFIWNSCFLLSGYFLYLLINHETNSKVKNYWAFVIIGAFWLGSYRHIGQTIYWATGGVYSLNLLLGALWLLGFNHMQNGKLLKNRIGFAFFTILVSLTTQNLIISLLTLLCLSLCLNYLESDRVNLKFNVLLLLILLGGTFFLSSAPGNFIRMKEINGGGFSHISLSTLLKNFGFILFSYLKFSFFLCLLALIIGLSIIRFKINIKLNNVVFVPDSKEKVIRFIKTYKYFLVALSTVLPFLTMPEVLSTRTTIYFMFFLFAFIIIFTERLSVTKKGKLTTVQTAIIVLIYSSIVIFGIHNYIKGSVLKDEITKREQLLKQSKNKVITVKVINDEMKSYCFEIRDYKDSEDWALKAQEIYFGVQKINLE
ncbi:DUF6056 family protein [Flavobacterium suncheonense]|uniref:DUF6056 family protein n=1 Tax=Flavobacterium suncheonense TaxID=350894 RepID=UPI003FA3AE85